MENRLTHYAVWGGIWTYAIGSMCLHIHKQNFGLRICRDMEAYYEHVPYAIWGDDNHAR